MFACGTGFPSLCLAAVFAAVLGPGRPGALLAYVRGAGFPSPCLALIVTAMPGPGRPGALLACVTDAGFPSLCLAVMFAAMPGPSRGQESSKSFDFSSFRLVFQALDMKPIALWPSLT